MRKNIRLSVAIVLTVLALLIGGGYWWQVGQYQESTDNAYVQSDIIYISAKQSGFAQAGWIQDNQFVREGEVLARIDDTDFQLDLAEAKAAVAAASAGIDQLEAQRYLQESVITAGESSVAAAQAERQLAAAELKRARELHRKKFASQDDLDNAITDNERKRAVLAETQAKLESSRRQLTVLDTQLQEAKATLAQAKARQDQAQQALSETIVRAPRDGIIGQRQVKDGQLIKAGQVLFGLVAADTVWVTANFKETQIAHMTRGQPVSLEIDAFPGQPVTGYIDSLWPASGAKFSLLPPENATGNFTKIVQRIPVKIAIPADQVLAGKLRAGMSVVASLNTQDKPVALNGMKVVHNNVAPVVEQHVAGY